MSIDLRFISNKQYNLNHNLFNENYHNERNILRPNKFFYLNDIDNAVNNLSHNEYIRLKNILNK